MTPQTDLTALQAERIILEWGDAVAAIQSAPGAPDYVDVGRAIAMGDLMADALRAALAGAETPQGMERYAEVSRHELRGPRADGLLACVFRRFEQQHPPPLGDGGNLIMLWRRDFAPPPAVAPPALVALVQEWATAHHEWMAPHAHSQDGPEYRRYDAARTALLAWTPDAAAPPVAEEAPYCERHGVMCALDETGRQWSCDCQTAELCPCGSGYVYTPNHATHAPPVAAPAVEGEKYRGHSPSSPSPRKPSPQAQGG